MPEIPRESNEKINKSSKNINNVLGSITESFVQKKLSEDIDFFSDKELETDKNYENLKAYLDETGEYEEYFSEYNNLDDEEKKKLMINVRKEVVKQKVGINKNIATAKKAIKQEFEITNEKKLDEKLKKIYSEENGKEKIKNILTKKISRHGFLKKNLEGYYKSKEENDTSEEMFSQIEGLNIDELSEEHQETLKKIYLTQQTIDTDDLIKFLSFLSQKNRNAILKHLNPTISLEDLVKNNIIKKGKALKVLERSLKHIKPKIKKEEINRIFNKNSNLRDIYITIEELEEREIVNFLETKEAFQPIVDELNYTRRKFKKDNTEKFYNDELLEINDEGKIHNNFINFIKEDNGAEIGSDVKNSINNLNRCSYIKVNSGKGDTYYYIEEIDLGGTKAGKHILIKNLTSKYGEGVRDKEYVQSETMRYEDLYRLFKSSKKVEGASVEFLSDKHFENLNIKESLEEENITTEQELKKLLNKEGVLDDSLLNIPFTELKLKDKEKNEEFYRFFSNTNDNNHSLTFNYTNQKILYSDFFSEIKKQGEKGKKLKLEKKINNLEELIDNCDFLKKQKIVLHQDGKKLVYEEDKNSEVEKGIELFIADTGETIYIKNITDNSIEFSTGEFKGREDKKDNKGNTKDKKGNEYGTIIKNEEKINYKGDNNFDYLKLLIDNGKDYKVEKYEAKNTIEDNNSKAKPFKEKGSFMGTWFSMASISEIIQGGEMMTNAIKEYFERGNDLKAAKFAQFFGGMLPEEVQAKLQFNTTEKRKDVIDKIFKQLDEQNASDAGNYIVTKILNNKHASKEEVFAAIKYMTLKRGSLYGKPFAGREKDYIWYQKLGGDLNSSEFKKWEKNAKNKDKENAVVGKKDPSFLVEENLLENVILKRLGKEGKYLYPRVEKDFNKYLNEGQEKRYTKGENETAAAYTVSEKTDNFISQLKGGEKSRAMGAVSKILSKNSTSTSLHFPGFLLSMSGYSKNFNPSEVNKIGLIAYTTPSTSLIFSLSEDLIDIYQNSIINYFNDTNRKSKAEELKKILKKPLIKRIESLETFWGENQNDLMNFLNIKDGIISLKKGTSEDKGGYYEKYFNVLKGEFDSGEFNYKEGDYLHTGKYGDTSLAEVGAEEALEHYLSTANNLSHRGDSEHFAHIFLHRLKDIKKNKFNHTLEEQKKLFHITYEPYEKKIRDILGSFLSKIDLKTDTGGIPKELRQYNLILNYGENEESNYNDFLDKAFENFINNDIKDEDGSNKVDDITEEFKQKIEETGINALIKPVNNDEYNPREEKGA